MSKEAMQMALEWFQWFHNGNTIESPKSSTHVKKALEEALTQPAERQREAVDAAIPLDKDEVAQLIAEHLGDTYHCTRVWEAWNVGTMGQDDFKPVDESETPAEIADAIIDAARAVLAKWDTPAPVGVEPAAWRIKALEPVAVRYDFDGFGWQYIDNGSGSDWITRYKDGEALYALGSKTA